KNRNVPLLRQSTNQPIQACPAVHFLSPTRYDVRAHQVLAPESTRERFEGDSPLYMVSSSCAFGSNMAGFSQRKSSTACSRGTPAGYLDSCCDNALEVTVARVSSLVPNRVHIPYWNLVNAVEFCCFGLNQLRTAD